MHVEDSDDSQRLGEVAATPGRANAPAVIHANLNNRPRSTPEELAADRALVKQVLAGERLAKDQFVERMRCIPRFIELRARSTALTYDELSDLAQDIFASIWRRLGDFRGEAPLEGWVHSFCVRSLSNHLRKRARRPIESGGVAAAEPPAPEAEPENPNLDPLRAALERLDDQQVEIVRLHGIEGLSYEECAKRIDCTPRAARARYQRAVTRLREILNDPAPNLHED